MKAFPPTTRDGTERSAEFGKPMTCSSTQSVLSSKPLINNEGTSQIAYRLFDGRVDRSTTVPDGCHDSERSNSSSAALNRSVTPGSMDIVKVNSIRTG
jgi:hypothetical protein